MPPGGCPIGRTMPLDDLATELRELVQGQHAVMHERALP